VTHWTWKGNWFVIATPAEGWGTDFTERLKRALNHEMRIQYRQISFENVATLIMHNFPIRSGIVVLVGE